MPLAGLSLARLLLAWITRVIRFPIIRRAALTLALLTFALLTRLLLLALALLTALTLLGGLSFLTRLLPAGLLLVRLTFARLLLTPLP